MVPTNSHLNDLMHSYFSDVVANHAHDQSFGPITLATDLVNLNDQGTYVFEDIGKSQHTHVNFECLGAITAGTVTLETSLSPGFTGNWHIIVNRQMSPAQTDSSIRIFSASTSGLGPFLNMRARVTAAIVGGTVNCYLSGTYVTHLF